jgi:hypothetical protein
MPVTEQRLEPAGIPTAVPEGGEGQPIVLKSWPLRMGDVRFEQATSCL